MLRSAPTLFALACLLGTPRAAAWQTRYFAHEDGRYLLPTQEKGGAAFVPPMADAGELPVIVFLHGTNETGAIHLWLGGKELDLRPVARRVIESQQVRPFILAAPSQTRHAAVPRALWSRFDLGAFVHDVAGALPPQTKVDRKRVLVVGHSGAGCNPGGGVATPWATGALRPAAIASIDPCLDAEMGSAMARRPAEVPLSVWWQSAVWPRSPEAFWAKLTYRKPPQRVDRLTELSATGPNAHEDVVPIAFERFVTQFLAAPGDSES